MFNASEEYILDLCALDKSQTPPARSIECPPWEKINLAIKQVYAHGGFVYVRVLKPENSYFKQLSMEALPHQFRIIVLTRDENPKKELLEWWEPGQERFKGTVRFGDDEWDARTVSNEMGVAQRLFYEFYEKGNLSQTSMEEFRSQWNPKP